MQTGTSDSLDTCVRGNVSCSVLAAFRFIDRGKQTLLELAFECLLPWNTLRPDAPRNHPTAPSYQTGVHRFRSGPSVVVGRGCMDRDSGSSRAPGRERGKNCESMLGRTMADQGMRNDGQTWKAHSDFIENLMISKENRGGTLNKI